MFAKVRLQMSSLGEGDFASLAIDLYRAAWVNFMTLRMSIPPFTFPIQDYAAKWTRTVTRKVLQPGQRRCLSTFLHKPTRAMATGGIGRFRVIVTWVIG